MISTLKRMWRSAMHDDARLRLGEVLARRGMQVADDSSGIYRAASATRRCVFCIEKQKCDVWLASGRPDGFEAFCPNADYIANRSRR